MSAQVDSFAGQLLHFARSVDIVNKSTMDRICGLVNRYMMKEGLEAQYFEFMRERRNTGDARTRLTTRWGSTGAENFWEIRTESGGYTNPITMSFDTDRALTVVAPDRAPLTQATTLEDRWSHVGDVEAYQPVARERQIRTLISVPVHYRHKLGIYYLETTRHIDLTDTVKTEFRQLAEALGILLELEYIGRGQSECTGHAIDEVTDLLQRARFPTAARPRLFLAFSVRADRAVVRIITSVLEEFSDKLDLRDWSEIKDMGSISAQIDREIAASPFGICYLSEPTATGSDGCKFVDNPNVLFEAGMLQARTTAAKGSGELAGWIPVREQGSPGAPSDIAGTRFLLVPRDASSRLQESKLRELLTQSLTALLPDAE